jgi:hypothetical protein
MEAALRTTKMCFCSRYEIQQLCLLPTRITILGGSSSNTPILQNRESVHIELTRRRLEPG